MGGIWKTLARRNRIVQMQKTAILNLVVCLIGAFCICLGLIVVAGWYTHSHLIVQMRKEFSPMQINTAICFVLSGVALISFIKQKLSITRPFSYAILVIAVLALLEHLFNTSLGIDELLVKSFIVKATFAPGRMTFNTTISFICIGISFMLLSLPYNKNRMILNLILIFVVLSLGIFSVLFYLFDITTHYGLSQWVRMAVHTSAGVIMLSLGLITAMYLKKKSRYYFPLLPLIATFSILVATFFSWQMIRKSQEVYLSNLLSINLNNITGVVQAHVKERATAFLRITYRWIHRNNTPEDEWQSDVNHYLQDQPGYISIMYVDKDYKIRWVAPKSEGVSIRGYNFYQDVSSRTEMLASKEANKPLFTNKIDLLEGGQGIILFSPIFKNNTFNGFMVGLINAQVMLDTIISRYHLNGYNIKITDKNEILYSQEDTNYRYYNDWNVSTKITILGRNWHIIVWPSSELYNQIITKWQPTLTLLIGILISFISGLLVQTLQLRQIETNKLSQTRIELADAHERLRGIIEGSEDMIAAIDLNYHFIVFNAAYQNEIYRVFKIQLQVGMSLNTILEKLSRENKEKVTNLWSKALQGDSFIVIETFSDKRLGNLDYEIHFNPIRDASGNIIGANHVATDVKPRLQNEKKLAESKIELENVVANLEKHNHELIVLEELMNLLQSCTCIKYVMETVAIYTKIILKKTSGILYLMHDVNHDVFTKEIHWGKPVSNILSFKKEDCWAIIRNHAHFLPNTDAGVICNHLKKSEIMPGAYACLPLHAQNEMMGLLYIELEENSHLNQRLIYLAQIISEQIALSVYNIKLRDELRIQSTHDIVTGLHNRRYFEEDIGKKLHLHKGKPFALLLLDIDFFKKINDTHGHLVGDKVLRRVSDTLKETCPASDLVSRWGGEEFIIYINEHTKTEVYAKAETIRQAIEDSSIQHEKAFLKVTVSIGISFYPADGAILDELISKADKALYNAKHSGRNKVC